MTTSRSRVAQQMRVSIEAMEAGARLLDEALGERDRACAELAVLRAQHSQTRAELRTAHAEIVQLRKALAQPGPALIFDALARIDARTPPTSSEEAPSAVPAPIAPERQQPPEHHRPPEPSPAPRVAPACAPRAPLGPVAARVWVAVAHVGDDWTSVDAIAEAAKVEASDASDALARLAAHQLIRRDADSGRVKVGDESARRIRLASGDIALAYPAWAGEESGYVLLGDPEGVWCETLAAARERAEAVAAEGASC